MRFKEALGSFAVIETRFEGPPGIVNGGYATVHCSSKHSPHRWSPSPKRLQAGKRRRMHRFATHPEACPSSQTALAAARFAAEAKRYESFAGHFDPGKWLLRGRPPHGLRGQTEACARRTYWQRSIAPACGLPYPRGFLRGMRSCCWERWRSRYFIPSSRDDGMWSRAGCWTLRGGGFTQRPLCTRRAAGPSPSRDRSGYAWSARTCRNER